MRGYIGVDLDGTLAEYHSGHGIRSVGKPIPAMVDRVKKWLADGNEVRVVTARVAQTEENPRDIAIQRQMIEEWCVQHVGQKLKVQCHKDYGLIELWDDRGVGVVANHGIEKTDIAAGNGWANGQRALKDHDKAYGIEGDANAGFEPEQRWECGGLPGIPNTKTICVDFPGHDRFSEFYIDSREARCLAASLLRAADEADAYDQLEPEEKDYP